MVAEVRCLNPRCGRPSKLGADALGRVFRCLHCGTRLPKVNQGTSSWDSRSELSVVAGGLRPWEAEVRVGSRGRVLGTAMPSRLGRFLVRGAIGSGSCATVYHGFDPVLEREVALKVPNPGSVDGSKAVARFVGEARALAKLRHPGIVAVFEAGRCGDMPYLATDYIEGQTLRAVLDDEVWLEYERAAEVAVALAEALDYAHGAGVVHRDVKPANVLVEPCGAVHLADFGLAFHGETVASPRTGRLIGSPAYVAPEQATGEIPQALPASDQYSLGVVLYEMLCGRPPFLGSRATVLYAASEDDPVPPRVFRPGLPRALERICLKAMARQPADRYASCRALAEELTRWLRRQRVGFFVSKGSIEGASWWLTRRPTAALSTALALLSLAASAALATVLLASPWSPDRATEANPSLGQTHTPFLASSP